MERKLLLVNCILCFSPYSISYDKQIIRKKPFQVVCVYKQAWRKQAKQEAPCQEILWFGGKK